MELFQCMKVIDTMRGTPVLMNGSLWLLQESTQVPGDVSLKQPQESHGVLKLASWCAGRAEEPMTMSLLSQILGAKDAVQVDVKALRRWTHAHAKMDLNKADFLRGMKSGERAFRRFRGMDIEAELTASQERYALWSRLCPTAYDIVLTTSWPGTQKSDAAAWEDVLLLRVSTIADWNAMGDDDPLAVCLSPERPMDAVLEWICQESSLPLCRALAALLLAQRHVGKPERQHRAASRLPGELYNIYQRGTQRLPLSLVAYAHWSVGGLRWPAIKTTLPRNATQPLRCVSDLVCLLFGAQAARRISRSLYRALERSQASVFLRRELDSFPLSLQIARANDEDDEPFTWASTLRRIADSTKDIHSRATQLLEYTCDWIEQKEFAVDVVLATADRVPIIEELASKLGETSLSKALQWLLRRIAPDEQLILSFWDKYLPTLLSFLLSDPSDEKQCPHEATARQLEALRFISCRVSTKRFALWWPFLCAQPMLDKVPDLIWEDDAMEMDLPIETCVRFYLANCAGVLYLFEDKPDKAALFVDYYEWFVQSDTSILPETQEVSAYDIASVFALSPEASDAALSVFLRMFEKTRKDEQDTGRLFAMVQALKDRSPSLEAAFSEWSDVQVEQPPEELSRLLALPGWTEDRALIKRYLHHKRIVGEGEHFSKALLEPLRLESKEAETKAYLEQKLASEELDEEGQLAIMMQLERYQSEERAARRLAAAVKRSHNRLLRALELLERRSLLRLLDRCCAQRLQKWLGEDVTLPMPLPKALREILFLLNENNASQALFIRFLQDALSGRHVRHWPNNRQWCERAAENGIDVDGWLAGFATPFCHGGEKFLIHVEQEPLEVLRMGSYFGTCLSLDGGENAHSAFCNAIDCNKHVVYIRNDRRHVVARKLITTNAKGELSGFSSYGNSRELPVAQMFFQHIGDFARRVGMSLSNEALPEDLHQMDWYNDGIEMWPGLSDECLPPLPDTAPTDEYALQQWEYTKSLSLPLSPTRDMLLAKSLMRCRCSHYLGFFLPSIMEGDALALWQTNWQYSGVFEDFGYLDLSTRAALFERFRAADVEIQDLLQIQMLLASMRPEKDDVESALKSLFQLATTFPVIFDPDAPKVGFVEKLYRPFAVVASLVSMIDYLQCVELYVSFANRLYPDDSHMLFDELLEGFSWAEMLFLGYLRCDDPRPLFNALKSAGPQVQAILFRVLTKVPIPGAMQVLRRFHKSYQADGENEPPHYAALACQCTEKDVPWLLQLQAQRHEVPCCDPARRFDFVEAIARLGTDAQREKACQQWLAPDDCDDLYDLVDNLGTSAVLRALQLSQCGEFMSRVVELSARSQQLVEATATQVDTMMEDMLCCVYELQLPAPYDLDSVWALLCEREPQWRELLDFPSLREVWEREMADVQALYDALQRAKEPDISLDELIALHEQQHDVYNFYESDYFIDTFFLIIATSSGEKKAAGLHLWLREGLSINSFWLLLFGGERLAPDVHAELLLASMAHEENHWKEPCFGKILVDAVEVLSETKQIEFWKAFLEDDMYRFELYEEFLLAGALLPQLILAEQSEDTSRQRVMTSFKAALMQLSLALALPILSGLWRIMPTTELQAFSRTLIEAWQLDGGMCDDALQDTLHMHLEAHLCHFELQAMLFHHLVPQMNEASLRQLASTIHKQITPHDDPARPQWLLDRWELRKWLDEPSAELSD